MENKSFEFYLTADLSCYLGKWIAIIDEKIVADSDSSEKVFKEAKAVFPSRTPLLVKVSKYNAMIL